MTMEERNRIVPLLSLFCSLFSHSLLSLHDAEFYGNNTGEWRPLVNGTTCLKE